MLLTSFKSAAVLFIFFEAAACCAPRSKQQSRSEVEILNFGFVEVEYAGPLSERVEQGYYDAVDSRIWNSGMPSSMDAECHDDSCVLIRSFRMARFNRAYPTNYVKERLRARGLRPANVFELFAFSREYPTMQWFYPIVALGTVWETVEDDEYVAVLSGHYQNRSAYLHWTDDEESWPDCFRFLAVPRQEN